MDSNELETLTDGLASPFWVWFAGRVDAEWGKNGERFEQAVMQAAAKGDPESRAYLNMIILAREEIRRLMKLPSERLNQLRNDRKVALLGSTPSRRGPGL